MIKILVTGSQGQIAQELYEIVNNLSEEQLQFQFFNKSQWDISDFATSLSIIKSYKPHYIINTAAYTKVDLAEQEINKCLLINAEAPTNLANICKNENIRFIHFSSDYVFQRVVPGISIREETTKSPLGIYSISKSLAEDQILECNKESLILRSSWIYSTYGNNFVKTMVSLAQKKEELRIVNDQTGSPTYAENIAQLILQIIHFELNQDEKLVGIYNYCNSGSTTWFEFALKIFELTSQKIKLSPISTIEYGAAAPRPFYSVLNCDKIKDKLKIEIADWKDSLKTCISKLHKNGFYE